MLSWICRTSSSSRFACVCLFTIPWFTLNAADNLPILTPAQVAAHRAAHEAEWKAVLQPGEPRLFLRSGERIRRFEAIRHADGKLAEYRQLLRDAADQIVQQPIPEYAPPEKRVSATLNLMQANEEGWQRGYGDRMFALTVAAAIFDDAQYKERLKAMVLAACRFDSWGRQGANGELRDMDLAAGHVVKGIAIAYDWNRSLFTETERAFIKSVMRERVGRLLQGLYGGIFWSNWYGQNHNHIAVAALGLAGLAFVDELPEAADWLAGSILNFENVGKSLAADGSSYEGLPYWSYGRSFILEFIEGTKTVADTARLYDSAGLRSAISHRLGCATPGFNGVIMWSDSRGSDVAGPHHILYRLASQYRDGRGQFLADRLPFAPQSVGGDTIACTVLWYDSTVKPEMPRELDYHANVWDVATSRSGWGDDDYLLTVKAGLNSNHHTHLDAGALALNIAGGWTLLAPGYGFGVGQSGFFDNRGKRWTFLSNSAESHSTLIVNGRNQRFDEGAGGKLEHLVSGANTWWAEVDLTSAYDEVTSVRRRILHQRGDYILVLDEIQAAAPVSAEWLAQMPPETTIDGAELHLDAPGAALKVQSLDGFKFYRREPNSPIRDVSPSRLATFAVQAAKGTHVSLANVLQPSLALASTPALRVSLERDAAQERITIAGSNWEDRIWSGEADPVQAAMGATTATARMVALRTEAGAVQSLLARSATQVSVAGATITATTPFDLSCEHVSSGAWVVSLATSFRGQIVLPADMLLSRMEGLADELPLGHATELQPGHYWLGMKSAPRDERAWKAADRFRGNPSIEPASIPSSPTLPLAPASIQVRWEAEAPHEEHFGRAKVEEIASASGGRALMGFGTESRWATAAWHVKVPVSGIYHLNLRYAIGQMASQISVLIDSAKPGQQSLRMTLPGQRGLNPERAWIVESRSWRESLARNENGDALTIPLAAGEHIIALSSPSEALNLDSFALIGAAVAK